MGLLFSRHDLVPVHLVNGHNHQYHMKCSKCDKDFMQFRLYDTHEHVAFPYEDKDDFDCRHSEVKCERKVDYPPFTPDSVPCVRGTFVTDDVISTIFSTYS